MEIDRLALALLTLPLVRFFETGVGRMFERQFIIFGSIAEG